MADFIPLDTVKSDTLAQVVNDLDIDMSNGEEIDLFDEDLQKALDSGLDSDPKIRATIDSLLAELDEPKHTVKEEYAMESDKKDESMTSQPSGNQSLSSSQWTISNPRSLTLLPTYIEVRLFTRQEATKKSNLINFFTTFMIPFLPGCLRESSTYFVMDTQAANLIKRSRIFQKVSSFFNIFIQRPTYTFSTSTGAQFVVTESIVPRFLNKAIPDPAYTNTDILPLVMTVTVDVSPRFNLHEVRHLIQQSQQQPISVPQTPEVTYLKTQPVSSRLGPPVPRFFSSTPNGNPQVIHLDASPLPTGTNPEKKCWAPKGPLKSMKAKNRVTKKNKGVDPLKPKKLFE